jgi:hypothetical protein
MQIKRFMIGSLLIGLFLMAIPLSSVSANGKQIGVEDNQDGITLTTDFITMKIVGDQPHFIWWDGNQSTSDVMYNVNFKKIMEFFGNDTTLDSVTELNGISYNLESPNWVSNIVEAENQATITLTLNDLANNAEIQFIVHIYTEDQPINGTDQVVNGLTEVKFDIVIKNWLFSENAMGLAFNVDVLESQQRHRVRIRNGTNEENGNRTRSMQFVDEDKGNKKAAYFEWATFANIYNDSDLIDTVDVGTAYFDPPGQAPDVGMIHFWLTYPNYGDSLTLSHDPSTGIYQETETVVAPFYILPIVSGLLFLASAVIIIKNSKK